MDMDRFEKEKQLDQIRSEVEDALGEIKKKFAAGTLFTLLVRHPALPESSMLLTEDSPEAVIEEIERFIK